MRWCRTEGESRERGHAGSWDGEVPQRTFQIQGFSNSSVPESPLVPPAAGRSCPGDQGLCERAHRDIPEQMQKWGLSGGDSDCWGQKLWGPHATPWPQMDRAKLGEGEAAATPAQLTARGCLFPTLPLRTLHITPTGPSLRHSGQGAHEQALLDRAAWPRVQGGRSRPGPPGKA